MIGSDVAVVLYDLLLQMGMSVPLNISAIGLNSDGAIDVGSTGTLRSGLLTKPFKPLRLYVPPIVGPDFEIWSIHIGDNTPIVRGPIHFDDGTHHWPMRCCPAEQEIIFTVYNRSAAMRHCQYVLFGVEENE